MSSLKEQDGRYYQECEVVMLAANYAKLTLFDYKDLKTLSYALGNHKGSTNLIPQHLYITSNEEINEKDWILFQFGSDLVEQVTKILPNGNIIVGENNYRLPKYCRKIIATTDETLYLTFNNGKTDLKFVLPKPSDSFIFKYIEEYNKGNIISDVLVEYKWNGGRAGDYEMIPKIDSNNTITIKKVKDSYSREEVINLLYKYNDGIIDRYSQLTNKDLDKWIKENL